MEKKTAIPKSQKLKAHKKNEKTNGKKCTQNKASLPTVSQPCDRLLRFQRNLKPTRLRKNEYLRKKNKKTKNTHTQTYKIGYEKDTYTYNNKKNLNKIGCEKTRTHSNARTQVHITHKDDKTKHTKTTKIKTKYTHKHTETQ